MTKQEREQKQRDAEARVLAALRVRDLRIDEIALNARAEGLRAGAFRQALERLRRKGVVKQVFNGIVYRWKLAARVL